MCVAKPLNRRVTSHYGWQTVFGKRFRTVVHDGLVVVLHTQTVNLSVAITIKRKLEF